MYVVQKLWPAPGVTPACLYASIIINFSFMKSRTDATTIRVHDDTGNDKDVMTAQLRMDTRNDYRYNDR